MAWRVVCGLLLVIATLLPTSALVSVDLPAFGRPTRLDEAGAVLAGHQPLRRRFTRRVCQRTSEWDCRRTRARRALAGCGSAVTTAAASNERAPLASARGDGEVQRGKPQRARTTVAAT